MTSLKFAFRTLFKTPFVTIIAIVSLALGIGANAAIFSAFNQMLLESLSVPRPAELRLFCDGTQVASARGTELSHRVERPGVHRLEAHLGGRTWILSNPVYLR